MWLRACFVRVAPNMVPDADGFVGGGVVVVDRKGRHTDPIATAIRANVWNAWAAGVTAGAALFQAAALVAHRLMI